MQTFLPYPDFQKTAICLDYKRLGKQRVEAYQLYKSLTEKNYSWTKHPASKMWKNYEAALLDYAIIITKEWINRGYKDTMLPRFLELRKHYSSVTPNPAWLDNKDFHSSHRSNLLRKNYDYYSKFGWKEPTNLSYVWIK